MGSVLPMYTQGACCYKVKASGIRMERGVFHSGAYLRVFETPPLAPYRVQRRGSRVDQSRLSRHFRLNQPDRDLLGSHRSNVV